MIDIIGSDTSAKDPTLPYRAIEIRQEILARLIVGKLLRLTAIVLLAEFVIILHSGGNTLLQSIGFRLCERRKAAGNEEDTEKTFHSYRV